MQGFDSHRIFFIISGLPEDPLFTCRLSLFTTGKKEFFCRITLSLQTVDGSGEKRSSARLGSNQ
ncbi:hypothetical protein JCM6292_3824 [Bacteroides pyogenes JCM 6292]|uniref:Uncharacterized protein n=2 Tax=Bacteroides pyogenes TaxID=310300 RepID=W4PD77_9BACE|nr:hypothetical protein JCM6292_3824 [Bacteroides pyogenes JCM 6292]GAE17717.1 hypothetical protein JCM6294_501 [Bacteroides pyogenes DSM 20611 = JCM 6294]